MVSGEAEIVCDLRHSGIRAPAPGLPLALIALPNMVDTVSAPKLLARTALMATRRNSVAGDRFYKTARWRRLLKLQASVMRSP
jgi:hypothetical protein